MESNPEVPTTAARPPEKETKVKPKKYRGVRLRSEGRWVAEIKDTSKNVRMWLGTFDSPEAAAMAYDDAARNLRGANARTNFGPRQSVPTEIKESIVPEPSYCNGNVHTFPVLSEQMQQSAMAYPPTHLPPLPMTHPGLGSMYLPPPVPQKESFVPLSVLRQQRADLAILRADSMINEWGAGPHWDPCLPPPPVPTYEVQPLPMAQEPVPSFPGPATVIKGSADEDASSHPFFNGLSAFAEFTREHFHPAGCCNLYPNSGSREEFVVEEERPSPLSSLANLPCRFINFNALAGLFGHGGQQEGQGVHSPSTCNVLPAVESSISGDVAMADSFILDMDSDVSFADSEGENTLEEGAGPSTNTATNLSGVKATSSTTSSDHLEKFFDVLRKEEEEEKVVFDSVLEPDWGMMEGEDFEELPENFDEGLNTIREFSFSDDLVMEEPHLGVQNGGLDSLLEHEGNKNVEFINDDVFGTLCRDATDLSEGRFINCLYDRRFGEERYFDPLANNGASISGGLPWASWDVPSGSSASVVGPRGDATAM